MKRQSENLIKYINENYKTDGTVFVKQQISKHNTRNEVYILFSCSVFTSGVDGIVTVEANTMLNVIRLIIATLDAKGLNKKPE